MAIPNKGILNKPGTLIAEWCKPVEQDRAEYYRFRHRFIDDDEEVIESIMASDFDFGLYQKLSLAKTFAKVIEIKVCPSRSSTPPSSLSQSTTLTTAASPHVSYRKTQVSRSA